MKYNQNSLDKLETILDECGYVYRYERGNFQSGYCILETKKVVVLNKFLNVEGRINTVIELLNVLPIDTTLLTPAALKTYQEAQAKALVA